MRGSSFCYFCCLKKGCWVALLFPSPISPDSCTFDVQRLETEAAKGSEALLAASQVDIPVNIPACCEQWKYWSLCHHSNKM